MTLPPIHSSEFVLTAASMKTVSIFLGYSRLRETLKSTLTEAEGELSTVPIYDLKEPFMNTSPSGVTLLS